MRMGAPCGVEGPNEGCLNGVFVVTSLVSHGQQTRFEQDQRDRARTAVGDREQVGTYQNQFGAIPEGAAYAPPRASRNPRIRGTQTVVVAGPVTSPAQTVHISRYGRIKG